MAKFVLSSRYEKKNCLRRMNFKCDAMPRTGKNEAIKKLREIKKRNGKMKRTNEIILMFGHGFHQLCVWCMDVPRVSFYNSPCKDCGMEFLKRIKRERERETKRE